MIRPWMLAPWALLAWSGCSLEPQPLEGHGPIASGISGPMGSPVRYATADQRAAFERGRDVAQRRFFLADGLGPAFNVTFCGSCHERPVTGGGAGLYRNFFLGGVQVQDGAFFPAESAGMSGGVFRLYAHDAELPSHPEIQENANVVAQRNPIPFFGAGLLAELPESAILANADPDDLDGDGISGRPNYDQGFVGRFGRKSQTVSLEGFIRGPLFNHLGVTTDPLSEAQKAALPIDSSSGASRGALRWLGNELSKAAQASAPAGPLTDEDEAPDPELSTDDLFDLVSFAMLLAAPTVDDNPSEQAVRGRERFDNLGCKGCHVPRLIGPRGPLPVYSDLLLHDMGEELADGLVQGEAVGNEFRTQPLWGLAAVGPYLHDGRASTVEEAILAHGGEAKASRDSFDSLGPLAREEILAFLDSLGGRDQYSPGLTPPDAEPIPAGELGGPMPGLSEVELSQFRTGQQAFDRDFGLTEGVGAPRFNGDSCRACHFEPIIGGAGPRGVNVIRHGIRNDEDEFVVPGVGTVLHRLTALHDDVVNRPQTAANVFELRQTPPLFGLGLVESIPDEVIVAAADPDDVDGDGISGRPSYTDGSRLGRFGWKAQVPSLAEFVRDAVTTELGMTLPYQPGLTFGAIHDVDDVLDPEMSLEVADSLTRYLQLLAPPPRQPASDANAAAEGEATFESIGCADCHTPTLPGSEGPVAAFSDFLLHEMLPMGSAGIEDASANVREFRTAPLWGLIDTAPYMHDGAADTIDEAIRAHDAEGASARDTYLELEPEARDALILFLQTL